MFERKHCQHVKNQLIRYSTELDKILKQMSDHLMLHKEEIFPDIVTSHFTVVFTRDWFQMININQLIYSLKFLTSVDLKPKETYEEFMDKFLTKIKSKFKIVCVIPTSVSYKNMFLQRLSRFFKK